MSKKVEIIKGLIFLWLFFNPGCEQKKDEIFTVSNYIFGYRYIFDSGIKKTDLNLDGIPDILFSDFVLFCNGNGMCDEPYKVTECKTAGDDYFNNTYSMIFTDLNKFDSDDISDFLCIENREVNFINLMLFKGTGRGAFNYLSSMIPDIPYDITDEFYYSIWPQLKFTTGATGDFNGDGFLDVVLPYFTYNTAYINENEQKSLVLVIFGDGMGNFKFSNFFETKPMMNVYSKVDDFNEDGSDDLLIIMWKPHFTIDYVPPLKPFSLGDALLGNLQNNQAELLSYIYISNGDGRFTEKYSYNGYIYIPGYDFNLDGKQDLIGNTHHQVDLLINNGDGTFRVTPISTYDADEDIFEIISGDFNVDGIQDIAYGKYYWDYEKVFAINTLLNNGNEVFVPIEEYIITNEVSSPVKMVTGDFNCDGATDIGLVYDGWVEIILGDGEGGLTNSYLYEISEPHTNNILADDFSGDGGTDLIVERTIRGNDRNHAGLSLFITQCQ